MKKERAKWFGLLGPVSLISYTVAVVFSPLAYPGYNWLSQAVSDLSAVNAPSRMLWNQLASFYMVSDVVCLSILCIYIEKRLNRLSRLGIYLFTLMQWISTIGYTMFPLTAAGNPESMQDTIHIFVITPIVILLSIISLIFIFIGGLRPDGVRSLGICAIFALILMFTGAIGVGLVPAEFFGVPERFSVFAATIFTAVLGVYMYLGLPHELKENRLS